jgi:hypothetical protein
MSPFGIFNSSLTLTPSRTAERGDKCVALGSIGAANSDGPEAFGVTL